MAVKGFKKSFWGNFVLFYGNPRLSLSLNTHTHTHTCAHIRTCVGSSEWRSLTRDTLARRLWQIHTHWHYTHSMWHGKSVQPCRSLPGKTDAFSLTDLLLLLYVYITRQTYQKTIISSLLWALIFFQNIGGQFCFGFFIAWQSCIANYSQWIETNKHNCADNFIMTHPPILR